MQGGDFLRAPTLKAISSHLIKNFLRFFTHGLYDCRNTQINRHGTHTDRHWHSYTNIQRQIFTHKKDILTLRHSQDSVNTGNSYSNKGPSPLKRPTSVIRKTKKYSPDHWKFAPTWGRYFLKFCQREGHHQKWKRSSPTRILMKFAIWNGFQVPR